MKVILLQDVKALGKKGEMVEVSDGYARNFILPKKVGIEASGANLNDLKLQKANEEKVAREQLEAAQAIAKELDEMKVVLRIKTGDNGRTFGAVTGKEIAQALEEQFGKKIDKKKFKLNDSIKSVGSFDVAIKLHPKVTASLKVCIEPEK